jgi:adenosylcobinamide-phosphate synthase
METEVIIIVALWAGYALDLLFADPYNLPHPVVLFGNMIGKGEKVLNRGNRRFFKGAMLSVVLVGGVFSFFFAVGTLLEWTSPIAFLIFNAVFVFYGLANQGLIREGRMIFDALEKHGLEAGRKQLSRIVGRETDQLSETQIRTAVFESMSENLSDGVIAPLFYFALLGIPGMMAYKMVNTLDSMIGYRSERYEQFGKFAARLDDVLNFIPARLTALLMVLVTLSGRGLLFIFRYGNRHKSPNSGYPEAALAGILNCRFGGPNRYHGEWVEKPYIGDNARDILPDEIQKVATINYAVSFVMIMLITLYYLT